MRKHLPLLGSLLAVVISVGTLLPVSAQAAVHHPYVNPFTDPAWQPSRTDLATIVGDAWAFTTARAQPA